MSVSRSLHICNPSLSLSLPLSLGRVLYIMTQEDGVGEEVFGSKETR